ncbi:hypothetical protein BLOT_001438 [Blomia tropicalis]|nr:hypothetical protein BLOT_001438 [Blomia tropicalis]
MVQTQRNKRFGFSTYSQNTTFYYYGFTNVLGQIRIHFSAKYITMNMFSNGSNSNCTHVPINIDWTDISRLRRKSNDRILFEFRDEAHFFINKSNSRKKSQLTIHFAKGTSGDLISHMIFMGCVAKRRYGFCHLRKCFVPNRIGNESPSPNIANSYKKKLIIL